MIIQLSFHIILYESKPLVTIECNFDNDMCGFTIHSNGDDPSKNGFIWKKGTANWIMNNELEGPDIGKLESFLDIEEFGFRF